MRFNIFNVVKRELQRPITIFYGLILGVVIGIYYPGSAPALAPWGHMVLSAIQMTVVPFVLVSIAGSVANLVSAKHSAISLKSTGILLMGFLLLESALGIAAGAILQPGNLREAEITNILQTSGSPPIREVKLKDPIEATKTADLVTFVTESVPKNVFAALSGDNMLQVVIFAIIFGAAMGVMPKDKYDILMPYFSIIQHAFMVIITNICIVLPIAVCFLIAEQVASINIDIFLTMIKFVAESISVIMIMLFVSSLIIWRRSGLAYWQSIAAMRFPILTTFATSDSHIGLPSAIDALTNKLKFPNEQISLVVPMGIATCRFGYVVYFSFATMFLLQLYSYPLAPWGYIIILLGSILVGFKSSGSPGLLTIPMMALYLDPLGIPLGGALALFLSVDLILEPFRSLGIVYINSACATLIAQRPEQVK